MSVYSPEPRVNKTKLSEIVPFSLLPFIVARPFFESRGIKTSASVPAGMETWSLKELPGLFSKSRLTDPFIVGTTAFAHVRFDG